MTVIAAGTQAVADHVAAHPGCTNVEIREALGHRDSFETWERLILARLAGLIREDRSEALWRFYPVEQPAPAEVA